MNRRVTYSNAQRSAYLYTNLLEVGIPAFPANNKRELEITLFTLGFTVSLMPAVIQWFFF